jgi:hypothetical protein
MHNLIVPHQNFDWNWYTSSSCNFNFLNTACIIKTEHDHQDFFFTSAYVISNGVDCSGLDLLQK